MNFQDGNETHPDKSFHFWYDYNIGMYNAIPFYQRSVKHHVIRQTLIYKWKHFYLRR